MTCCLSIDCTSKCICVSVVTEKMFILPKICKKSTKIFESYFNILKEISLCLSIACTSKCIWVSVVTEKMFILPKIRKKNYQNRVKPTKIYKITHRRMKLNDNISLRHIPACRNIES